MSDKKNSRMLKKNIILLILVIVLAVFPLVYMKKAKFSGSDDQAKKTITKIDANYKPWFSPIWTPPSGEIESLMFALQAALGAGFMGYFFGYSRGKKISKDRGKI